MGNSPGQMFYSFYANSLYKASVFLSRHNLTLDYHHKCYLFHFFSFGIKNKGERCNFDARITAAFLRFPDVFQGKTLQYNGLRAHKCVPIRKWYSYVGLHNRHHHFFEEVHLSYFYTTRTVCFMNIVPSFNGWKTANGLSGRLLCGNSRMDVFLSWSEKSWQLPSRRRNGSSFDRWAMDSLAETFYMYPNLPFGSFRGVLI